MGTFIPKRKKKKLHGVHTHKERESILVNNTEKSLENVAENLSNENLPSYHFMKEGKLGNGKKNINHINVRVSKDVFLMTFMQHG